jgi:hypothetical protein
MNLVSISDNEYVMPSVMSSKRGGGASTSLMGYHHNNNNNISHRGAMRGDISGGTDEGYHHAPWREAVVHALHLLTCTDVTKTATTMMATTQQSQQ